MAEWQPIETAPKNGFFLVCDMSGHPEDYDVSSAVVWIDTGMSDKFLVDATICECCGAHGWLEYARSDPTHWMPLPEPPDEKT